MKTKFLLTIFLIGNVLALDSITKQQGDNVILIQTCSDASSINISSIAYPNSSIAVSDIQMTNLNNGDFRYDFNLTNETGTYDIRGISNGCERTFAIHLDITPNGKPTPSGAVIVFFNFLFIVIVAGLLSLLLYTVFHFIALDFDARDLIMNISSYFTVFAIYILSREYLGNKFINDFMIFLIDVGALATVVLPIIAFVVCFIKAGLELKNQDKY